MAGVAGADPGAAAGAVPAFVAAALPESLVDPVVLDILLESAVAAAALLMSEPAADLPVSDVAGLASESGGIAGGVCIDDVSCEDDCDVCAESLGGSAGAAAGADDVVSLLATWLPDPLPNSMR